MLELVLKSLKNENVENVYFDNYKINNINKYNLTPHFEENTLELNSGNELFGGETIFLNLNSISRIKIERQSDPDAG